MPEKHYLIKMVTNTAGQDGSTVSVYDNLENAQVAYHNDLASYHNAADVLYAVVQIVDGEYGNLEAREIVDHRPEPNDQNKEED